MSLPDFASLVGPSKNCVVESVPRSKHTPVSDIKTSQLMLYSEIIAVYSEIHTKHINTLCGQEVELLNVKLAGTWALKG